jgi:alkylation response protein AidB-like acyl-CoA dehydrogenase
LHSDIIAPYLLNWYQPKAKYLPLMAKELITADRMTEPNCGSDLKALRTTAEDKGDHYL